MILPSSSQKILVNNIIPLEYVGVEEQLAEKSNFVIFHINLLTNLAYQLKQ